MSGLDEILSGAEEGWVDAALRRAHPATTVDLASMDLEAGFDDLLEQIWSADQPGTPDRPRGRRRRVVVSLAITGALLGIGGVAAAVGMSGALTGLFGKAGNTENDTSEYVDATKPDFPGLAQQWATQLERGGLRFAPGYDPQGNINSVIASLQQAKRQLQSQGVRSLVQVTGVKGDIAHVAACTWESSWLDAHQARDQASMNAAALGMHQTAGLPVMSQINAANWLTGLANDADQGNATPIHTDVTLNCSTVVK
jgi:hypothetical protein